MLFNTLAVSSLLVASAMAVANPRAMPYKLDKSKLVKMSAREIFGLSARQDSGYAPTQNICNGPGDTCETACGADSVQCPSTDGSTHCFVPGEGQLCCPDGLGNACDKGYYCTDNSDGTWCCPDGTSVTDCAALYGVTSLTSQAPITTIPIPGGTGIPTGPASETAASETASVTSSASSAPTDTVIIPTTTAPSGGIPTYTPGSNGTVTTSSPPTQFTGAANHVALGALPALALAAGVALVM